MPWAFCLLPTTSTLYPQDLGAPSCIPWVTLPIFGLVFQIDLTPAPQPPDAAQLLGRSPSILSPSESTCPTSPPTLSAFLPSQHPAISLSLGDDAVVSLYPFPFRKVGDLLLRR